MSDNFSTKRARIRGHKWTAYDMVGLGISVGKSAHEGEDLAAAIEMVLKLGKPCLVRVSDTLQCHNLMAAGMGAKEALDSARQKGNEWLERNSSMLERLPMGSIIVRWDDVRNDPEFGSVLSAFVHLSHTNASFSAALNDDVERFLKRRTFASSEERAIMAQCSKDFLLEELAGQTILGRKYHYAGFYPGSFATVLKLACSQQIAGAPKGMENTALVEFDLEPRKCALQFQGRIQQGIKGPYPVSALNR